MDPVKHFDLLFGGVFAAIGTIILIVGAAFCVFFARKPPRERVTWTVVWLPIGMGILFTAIGGIWAGSALNQMQLEDRLRASGVTIRATVVDVEQTSSRLNGRYLWQIRYEYQDPAGRHYEGVSDKMERIDAERFRIGEQAFIRYDPAEPSASIWLGHEDLAQVQHTTFVLL